MVLVVPLFERQGAGRLPQLGRRHRRRRQRCSACTGRCTSRTTRSSTRSTTSRPGRHSTSRRAGEANGFKVWKTRYATIGVLICWDQWYPGGRAHHGAAWARRCSSTRRPSAGIRRRRPSGAQPQVDAWRTIQRAPRDRQRRLRRVAEPRRPRGRARHRRASRSSATRSSPIRSDGCVAEAGEDGRRSWSRGAIPALIESVRRNWPFLRDRRVDAYGPILNRYLGMSRHPRCSGLRMPAEWEPHRATWISWPHHEPDWPGKLGADPVGLRRDRARARRARAARDPLPQRRGGGRGAPSRCTRTACAWIACGCTSCRPTACGCATRRRPASSTTTGARACSLELGVQRLGEVRQLRARRRRSGRAIARLHRPAAHRAAARTAAQRLVLEGGGIDVNGRGLVLVTEEWLLSDVQVRNPGLDARRLRARVRRVARRAAHDLAGRGLRRRRHARPRRRHRALRVARHGGARGRRRSRRREPRAVDRQPAPPRDAPARDRRRSAS